MYFLHNTSCSYSPGDFSHCCKLVFLLDLLLGMRPRLELMMSSDPSRPPLLFLAWSLPRCPCSGHQVRVILTCFAKTSGEEKWSGVFIFERICSSITRSSASPSWNSLFREGLWQNMFSDQIPSAWELSVSKAFSAGVFLCADSTLETSMTRGWSRQLRRFIPAITLDESMNLYLKEMAKVPSNKRKGNRKDTSQRLARSTWIEMHQ